MARVTDKVLLRPGEKGAHRNLFREYLGKAARPNKLVELPGEWGENGFRTRLWCLNDEEILTARTAATAFLAKHFGEGEVMLRIAADPNVYNEEFDRQILAIALRDPEDADRPLLEAVEIRAHFSPDQRAALMRAVADFTDERNPLRKLRTDAEVRELAELLGKEPAASELLTSCDIDTLRLIARALATALIARTKVSSSST